MSIFTARRSNASAVLGVVIVSVCPSLCHWRALWQNERTYIRYFDITWKDNHSSFLKPTEVGGGCPSHVKFRLKLTHRLRKRWLRPISAYIVSTVRDSEKSSIITYRKSTTGLPVSYRRSVYVTFKSPKGGSKKNLPFLWTRFNSVSNEVCNKLSFCQNFQRHSCSINITLSNGP